MLRLIVFLLLFSNTLFANDIQLEVHQSVLEKFLSALAPIQGSGEYKSPAGAIPYRWEVQNPTLSLTNGEALFRADTTVAIAGAKYRTVAKGKGQASYDTERNKLVFQVTQASFSIAITLFGNTINLADIDISNRLNQKFEMDMAAKLNQTIKVRGFGKNDPPRYVQLSTVDPSIKIEEKKILVYSDVSITPTGSPLAL